MIINGAIVLINVQQQAMVSFINGSPHFTMLEVLLTKITVLLRSLDEGVTLILTREIYLCTCSMEVRQVNWGAFWRKILGVTVAVFVPILLYELVGMFLLKGQSFTTNSVAMSSLDTANVVSELIFTSIVVAILYHCAHILRTLFQSNRFRGQTGRGNRKNAFVVMLVLVILGVRILRLAIMIAKVALTTILWRDIMAGKFQENDGDLLNSSKGIEYLDMGNLASGIFELCYVWIPGTFTKMLLWKRGNQE